MPMAVSAEGGGGAFQKSIIWSELSDQLPKKISNLEEG